MKATACIASGVFAVGVVTSALVGGAAADGRPATDTGSVVREADPTTVAYRAARVYHHPGRPPLDDAYLVVTHGKVAAVATSADALPPLTPVVDLGSAVLIPGLVAADSTLTGSANQGDHALGAHRRALDGFDPFEDLHHVLGRGVTTCYLSPERSRLIGGRGAVVKTAGAQRVLREVGDLRVSLTRDAQNPPRFFRPPIPPTSENPLRPPDVQPPSSRAGAMMVLREQAALAADGGGGPAGDAHLQALATFLAEPGTLRVAADSEGEVRAALELAAEWGTPLVLDGATEAARAVEDIRNADAAVVFDVPLFLSLPSLELSWEAPPSDALRQLAGLEDRLALGVGRHGRWTWLLEAGSAAMGYGLSEGQALAAVTHNAARILGVGNRVGRLLPDYDADFVALSGNPFDPGVTIREVYIGGEKVWSQPPAMDESALALASGGVVVRGGTLWTGDGPPLRGGGEVLLQDGKVVAAGARVPHPPGARIVDAGADAHLTPGFIDARGWLGLSSFESPDPEAVLGLLAAGSRTDPSWNAVARAGITTMVVAPRRLQSTGTLAQAVKTAATLPEEAFVADRQLVLFKGGEADRAAQADELRKTLNRGKSYFEKWKKYAEERAKWEEEQARKAEADRDAAEAELRKRLAQGAEAVEEEEETEEEEEGGGAEEEETAKVRDPINGLWEGTLEDERLPEPVTINARIAHEGERVTALLSSPDFPGEDEFELEGTWNEPLLKFEIPTEFGTLMITGEVDVEDHMIVTVNLAGLGSGEFEMVRTEYDEEGGIAATTRRRKKDDGPKEPKRDWKLEGMRALFEGRATALVEANRSDEIRTVITVFGEHELPVQILGGREAHELADWLREKEVGVVVDASLVQREKNRDVVPAARLRARGVATAFQSGASDGARFLPQALALATRFGLGADQALESFTAGAARLLGIDHRVGALRPGLDGDVVVLSGPPFDLRSRVLHVFVNGREVPRESEQ